LAEEEAGRYNLTTGFTLGGRLGELTRSGLESGAHITDWGRLTSSRPPPGLCLCESAILLARYSVAGKQQLPDGVYSHHGARVPAP
jgi:hypothetical protein